MTPRMQLTAEAGCSRIGEMTDLPDIGAGRAFDQGLERRQAAVVDDIPDLARPGQQDAAVRNRTDAVIDQEDESQGEQQQPDKPQHKPDHIEAQRPLALNSAFGRRRLRTAYPARPRRFNPCRHTPRHLIGGAVP